MAYENTDVAKRELFCFYKLRYQIEARPSHDLAGLLEQVATLPGDLVCCSKNVPIAASAVGQNRDVPRRSYRLTTAENQERGEAATARELTRLEGEMPRFCSAQSCFVDKAIIRNPVAALPAATVTKFEDSLLHARGRSRRTHSARSWRGAMNGAVFHRKEAWRRKALQKKRLVESLHPEARQQLPVSCAASTVERKKVRVLFDAAQLRAPLSPFLGLKNSFGRAFAVPVADAIAQKNRTHARRSLRHY